MMNGAKGRAQLSGDELQQLRWLLGGVVMLVSLATVFYLEVGAWWLMGLTAGVVVGMSIRPDWPARVSRWVHRLAFPFIAAFFSADLWISGELLPAMVRLDLLLLLYRALIYRQKRDDLQVIVLGLFLVVVAGVLSVSLTFAVHILLFTACALAFLLTITLAAGGERKTEDGEQPGAGEVPGWARQVRWGRLLGRVRAATHWRVVALGGAMFGGLVVVSGLLFLAIPRFQLENSFFLERFISKKALSGFSDTIKFGDVTEITLDESVALRVDVSDRTAIPTSPYWRMLVLDEYREGTFRLSTERRAALGAEQGGMAVRGGRRRGSSGAAQWTFYLEPGVSRYLPLLGRFELLVFNERQNYRYGWGMGVLALRDDPVTMTAYRVAGMDHSARWPDRGFAQVLENGGSAAATMRRLNVGEEDVAALERVVAEIGGAGIAVEEFVRRAEAWLGRRHAYSLQPRIPAGEGDPLVRWLGSEEGGHCELFAGSLTMLARAAGIPARVVTGFRGGSWNGYSNNFTLRNSDAHAWCEVFDAATGMWLRADPTPGAAGSAQDETRGEATLERRLDRSWTARLDSLRVFWYRRIVSFDEQSQRETIQAVKDAGEAMGRRLRALLERVGQGVKGWLAAPWDWRRAGAIAAGVGLCAVLAWAAMKLRFTIYDLRLGPGRRKGDRVRTEAGRWLARWPAAGKGNAEAEAIRRALERLRFGAPASWEEPRAVFKKARQAWRRLRRARTQGTR